MSATAPQQRLVSLDALRGFDMLWILGLGEAEGLLQSLLKRFAPGCWLEKLLDVQFEHVDWAGFHFEDAIFPTFLFISGASLAFAVPRRLEQHGKASVVKHLLLRALIIFVLGVIYSGGLSRGIHEVRWLGVIQRIGFASAAAGILSLWMNGRGLLITAASLLIGYWLMLAFIPVPGIGAGNYAEGMNFANYLDSIWLPGRKYHETNEHATYDPEGILSTLPAIAHAILGLLAGQWLRRDVAAGRKVLLLAGTGLALFGLGWAWHPFFPVVKKLWSSSFVLVATGVSAMVLAVFYWIIDLRGWKAWSIPCIWIGANPLTLYLMHGMGFFRAINVRLVGQLKGDWHWVSAATAFALLVLTARFLYRKGIFLRV